MRPLGTLGLLLTGCLLAGCGSDGGSATDAGPSQTPSPGQTQSPGTSQAPDPSTSGTTVIVSESAAGGTTSTTGVELSDAASVASFTDQFTNPRLGDKVDAAVASTVVATGQRLYGAVVAVGCDVPTDVVVSTGSTGSTGVAIAAAKVTSPQVQCLVPVTTVALVVVGSD